MSAYVVHHELSSDPTALIAVLTLAILLVEKELTTSLEGRFARALNRVLDIGIVPLIMAFVLIVVAKLTQ
jgi:hypothetical protein